MDEIIRDLTSGGFFVSVRAEPEVPEFIVDLEYENCSGRGKGRTLELATIRAMANVLASMRLNCTDLSIFSCKEL